MYGSGAQEIATVFQKKLLKYSSLFHELKARTWNLYIQWLDSKKTNSPYLTLIFNLNFLIGLNRINQSKIKIKYYFLLID